ncbi:hypothetical protein KC19_4G018800 [Ceratodon purpureus]|uniref:Protein kinase domain-containing protein n=1 Tax=Ceratodon purpureus TaxID=3225 RepID=A0A8T0I498_CERPU|nr:hypothetical protein KC19_4G018800 [Ceratodon purpureus]
MYASRESCLVFAGACNGMLSLRLSKCRSSSVMLVFFVLFGALSFSALSEITNISFPQFSSNDPALQGFGDVQYSAENRSWIMNAKSVATSTETCAMLIYDGKSNMRIQDSATGAMASFSTSFTFKFTTPPQQQVWDDFNLSKVETAMIFIIGKSADRIVSLTSNQVQDYARDFATHPGACVYTVSDTYVYVCFRTAYNPLRKEPSNNFIGARNASSDRLFEAGSTYNLCGNNETHCSYLSTGEIFTAWIDFIPPMTLQVRLMNGSHAHSEKPPSPLFENPNFKLPSAPGDYLYFNFIGSSNENHIEAHELTSWTLYSDGIPETISSPRKKPVAPIYGIIGGVIGFVAIFLVVCYLLLRTIKHRRQCSVKPNHSSGPRIFMYKELCAATNNFNEKEKLGSGSFGTVYRGSIESSQVLGSYSLVAVKLINHGSKHAKTTFTAEISSLTQIQHGNVVPLQGWCHDKGQLLLVYDYMSNGSLDEWLHGSSFQDNAKQREVLSLKMRHSILQDVATALEYLHNNGPKCVLHRDIKSSNVMLDANLKAHLGDFGLARLMDHPKLDKTTIAAGTIGYMAPEVSYTGKATKQSDVYSFGILILEVVCGRRPLDLDSPQELNLKTSHLKDNVLLHSVWQAHEAGASLGVADPRLLYTHTQQLSILADPHLSESAIIQHDSSLSKFIDANMEGDKSVNDQALEAEMIKSLLQLGLLCCLPNPKDRPCIEQVIQILHQIGNIDKFDHEMGKLFMPPLPKANPVRLHLLTESLQGKESMDSDE